MKNVTVSLDEKTAEWARKEASRAGISLSRFIGSLLQESMAESRAYERAMREYLAVQPKPISTRGARYPSRDELHER